MPKITVRTSATAYLENRDIVEMLIKERGYSVRGGDCIIDGKVWEDLRGKDYVVRDATPNEIEVWNAFTTLIEYYKR